MRKVHIQPSVLDRARWQSTIRRLFTMALLVAMWSLCPTVSAQGLLQRVDSLLAARYRKGGIDTAYVVRPGTNFTVRARLNVSGSEMQTEGNDGGQYFKSELEANRKSTLSLGVSYLGLSLSFALNPAKLLGKYDDYELNLTCYGRRFGFDVVYQDAKNYTGWHDQEGYDRFELPDEMLKVKTLNLNTYYVFNSRRFSYPAAFSQSYIQRRSAGSFLLAASGMSQEASLDWGQGIRLRMGNISLGAGYGYNFVPGKGWLLHISALPTFIVYSKTSLTFGDGHVSLRYRFPEVIINGRGSVVRQWSNKFVGLSMVYTYSNIGSVDHLAVYNSRWLVRTFFGLRF